MGKDEKSYHSQVIGVDGEIAKGSESKIKSTPEGLRSG